MMVGDPGRGRQWCLRVPAAEAETVRQALIAEGALDRVARPRREGNDVLLPITAWREGAEEGSFEANPERPELPRHELIGGIAVMQDDDPRGAALILASRPNLHTVLYATSEVEGEYRTKSFRVLAGIPTTRTEVVEHGSRFMIDLSAAYFSARLATERQRVAAMVADGEVVLDMFAGVGPFAIALARHAALVVAADINPAAVGLMQENISRNKVRNAIPTLADARRLAGVFPWQFDRIIMNLPKSGESFLPDAFRLCRAGGMIHFYALVSAEGEHRVRIGELGGEVIAERVVRSYSPARWHTVYDIVVNEKKPLKSD
ncbi:MAG: tRNA (guanine(37)-N1)-methyltransferase Trm5b [Methanoregula sp. PtaU1.Bin051]|nr:MAG: tRNA (guanine(37)-N1)-methyltransferase Trm5b [Methanoregula sp. PtaU1.Bin051]